MPMSRRSLSRVASAASESAKETARRIMESDLAQFAMVLTTIVAAVVYGWVEGYALAVPDTSNPAHAATQSLWLLGHFSTYNVALGILFLCVTGGFSLIKSRSMFAKGKRYFLLTFVGNYPFSWMVEDFAFFFFCPDPVWCRLNERSWTNWILGGVYILDPWRPNIKLWIPAWYLIVGAWWLGMMWYAHRCTVYDNIIKDQIAREIIPGPIEIPAERAPKQPEFPPEPFEYVPPVKTEPVEMSPAERSPEAQEALRKLREKWIRDA